MKPSWRKRCHLRRSKNYRHFFVFFGGSNLLVSDKGFAGVVVRVANQGSGRIWTGRYSVSFTAAAGEGFGTIFSRRLWSRISPEWNAWRAFRAR